MELKLANDLDVASMYGHVTPIIKEMVSVTPSTLKKVWEILSDEPNWIHGKDAMTGCPYLIDHELNIKIERDLNGWLTVLRTDGNERWCYVWSRKKDAIKDVTVVLKQIKAIYSH